MKRLLALGLALWIGRWALLEVASHVSRGLPPRRSSTDPDREPGHMPGPFDR